MVVEGKETEVLLRAETAAAVAAARRHGVEQALQLLATRDEPAMDDVIVLAEYLAFGNVEPALELRRLITTLYQETHSSEDAVRYIPGGR